MKCIKYLAMVLFAGALMTSCADETVDVGETTVQFANTEVKSGFGAGVVYVPIEIEGPNFAAMNISDVNIKVKVDETYTNGNVLIGKADEDFMITSTELKFINNYKEEDKKFDEDGNELPFNKQIAGVEVFILNTEPEVMEFKLVIESVNTTLGANNECVVRLEKGATDRLCGDYAVEATVASPFDGAITPAFKVSVAWKGEYFEIAPFDGFSYTPVYAYWDEESESMYMLPFEPLLWYSSANMQMVYQMFFSVGEGGTIDLATNPVVLETDVDNGIIKFPTNLYFGMGVYPCDAGYNPNGSFMGRFTSFCAGYVMTKQ